MRNFTKYLQKSKVGPNEFSKRLCTWFYWYKKGDFYGSDNVLVLVKLSRMGANFVCIKSLSADALKTIIGKW